MEVSIAGTEFLLNGRPTYAGRRFEGCSVQGLLFNVRAVQATFDDANPDTRPHWVYPDTGEWDPDRNTSEFCEGLSSWRDHGVLGFTINFQGGGSLYGPDIYDHYDNNGFTADGELEPAYADRIRLVLRRADELGMVVIAGLFYWVHVLKLRDEQAVWRAARQALAFLADTGCRNVLIEIANETHERFGYGIFRPEQSHEMIETLRQEYPRFLYSTSLVGARADDGRGMPPPSMVQASDYVLLHGNGCRADALTAAIEAIKAMPAYRRNPKPLVVNEDSPGLPNLAAAWRNGVSWGYFDQGYGGEAGWKGDAYVDYRSRPREDHYEDLSGFQTLPVNWAINTDLKRAFFDRVAQITGAKGDV